jgi:hypothetical protein
MPLSIKLYSIENIHDIIIVLSYRRKYFLYSQSSKLVRIKFLNLFLYIHCTDQLQENTCIIKRLRACWLLKLQRLVIPVYGGMVFNATFNNISVIDEGNRSTRINHRPATSHWKTLSHNVVLEYTSLWAGFEITKLVVINTDGLGRYISVRSQPWRLLFLYNIQDDKFINVKYTTM